MSESAPRINPEDVFPRRNLPGSAEQWGRVVEDRTRELEKNAVAVNQSLHGANRDTAAQLAAISEQLRRLNESTYVFVWEGTNIPTTPLENTPPGWASWGLVSGGMSIISGVLPPSGNWSRSVAAFTRRAGDPNATQILDWFASNTNLDQMALTSTAVIDVRGGATIETNLAHGGAGTPPGDTRFRLSYFIQWVSDTSPSPISLEI